MKKLILTLALVAMGTVAYAQTSASADISATAIVQSAISVAPGQNIEFGTVTQGGGPYTIAYNAANAGTFTVTGQPNISTTLTLTLPGTLTGGDGDPLPITYTAGYDVAPGADINPSTGVAFTGGASAAQSVNLNASGFAYVSVGASIEPTAAHSGSHSGTITLNATYN